MCFFGKPYESFDFSRYVITLVDRCHQSPQGCLISELMPGVFALCFGTPKRNEFVRFRSQFHRWSTEIISNYCTTGFCTYPEEIVEAVLALEHGCAVAIHVQGSKPLGLHVVDSKQAGLATLASDLKRQAMTGRLRG